MPHILLIMLLKKCQKQWQICECTLPITLYGGAVEKENGTIKNQPSKVCEGTGLNLVKALPLVLMSMRRRGKPKTGLPSFEIIMGRPMSTGMSSPGERQTLRWEESTYINLILHQPLQLSKVYPHTDESSLANPIAGTSTLSATRQFGDDKELQTAELERNLTRQSHSRCFW